MAKSFSAASLFVMVFGNAACAPTIAQRAVTAEDLRLRLEDLEPPPANVSREQARDDIARLLFALSRGYGGREFVPQAEWQRVLDKLRRMPATCAPSCTPAELCARINHVLADVPDNHLQARLQGRVLGDRANGAAESGRVGSNVHGAREPPWAVTHRTSGGVEIPILSITTFPFHEEASWSGFLEAA